MNFLNVAGSRQVAWQERSNLFYRSDSFMSIANDFNADYIVNQVYAHEYQYNDNSLVNPEDYINIIEINFSSMADS